MEPARRIKRLPAYLFAKLEEKAAEMKAQGVDLIDLGIADPDLTPPSFIIESVKRHLTDLGAHQYPTSQGDIEVRAAVADWFLKRFNVKVNPKTEIAVTMGSKEGLANISRAYINAGDVVGAPDPGYPVYANAAAILNDGMVRSIPLRPDNGFLPDLSLAVGCKLLYLNYPNNPTGVVAPESFYAEVGQFAEKHPETLVIWDAAYCELSFGGFRPPSILNYTRNAIEFHSLSKMMNVTGYRIGFAVGSSEAIGRLVKVKTQIDSGAPVFIQRAMADALGLYKGQVPPKECVVSHSEYGLRKQLIEKGFKTITGVEKVYESPATFFMWAKVEDDLQFVEDALELGVILTPGSGFGSYGKGFVRAAVTAPYERIEEAINRLGGDVPKREKVSPLAYPTTDEANAVIELLDEDSIAEIETDEKIRIVERNEEPEVEASPEETIEVEEKAEIIEDAESNTEPDDNDMIDQILDSSIDVDTEVSPLNTEINPEDVLEENGDDELIIDESGETVEETSEEEELSIETEILEEEAENTEENLKTESEFESFDSVDDLLGNDSSETTEPLENNTSLIEEPEPSGKEQSREYNLSGLSSDEYVINHQPQKDLVSELQEIEEIEDNNSDILDELLNTHESTVVEEETVIENEESTQGEPTPEASIVEENPEDVLDISDAEIYAEDEEFESEKIEEPTLFTTITEEQQNDTEPVLDTKKAEIVDDVIDDFVPLSDYEEDKTEELKVEVEEVKEEEKKRVNIDDINEISSDQVLEIFDELDDNESEDNISSDDQDKDELI